MPDTKYRLTLEGPEIDDALQQMAIRAPEGWTQGTKDGVPVGSSSQYYHNNAKYYAEQASDDATTASTGASTADARALDSEAWAVGQRNGVDVDSSDPTYHNNAKYYAEHGGGGGGGGTSDYDDLDNRPQINSVTLTGNKSASDLGLLSDSLVVASNNGKVLAIVNGALAAVTVSSLIPDGDEVSY